MRAERVLVHIVLTGALAQAGLPLAGTHHRGIDDARNIARLLPFALGADGRAGG